MEPYRRHQEGEDCFLRYLAKRIKALTKKLDGHATTASPTMEQDKMDPALRRKQIEDEIQQFQCMRDHYFNALARKDEKDEKSADPESVSTGTGMSYTLAELLVFGGLSSKDTVVHQQLNSASKEQQLSYRQSVKTLFEVDQKQETLPIHELIRLKAIEIEKALTDKHTLQALHHLQHLKFKSYSDLKQ